MTHARGFITVMISLIVVPAAFADFPVQQSLNKETSPVVAYNSINHEYLAVWAEEFRLGGATGVSLKGRRVGEGGAMLGDAFMISPFTAYPTVVYNPLANEFVVAGNSYGNIVGQRVSSSGSLLGRQTTLMSGAEKARIACNSITGEYLVVGVHILSAPGGDQLFFSSTISADLETVSTPKLLLSRIPGDAINARGGSAVANEVDIALAFAPIQATETPTGRYLLVLGPGVDVRMLDSDGELINVLHDDQAGKQYPQLPFCTSYPAGEEINVDVAFGWGTIDDLLCPVFLVVWSDRNNTWAGLPWSGIWGGYVDATNLAYDAHALVPDRAFPISSASVLVTNQSLVADWRPQVSYNPSSQTFLSVWRETPTDPAQSPTLKTHIRSNTIKGADAWINVIVSDTAGNEDPRTPTVASSTTSEYALILWQDSRDSVVTGTDIFGSIEKVGKAVVVPPGGIVVTNADDEGVGSLRQAILGANARVGRDSIKFNIPGAGPHSIRPSSPLPVITDTLVIDGYSQTGSVVNTNSLAEGTNAALKIELDGSNAGPDASGLVVASPWCVVRGLVVNRFANAGIAMVGDYIMVFGCFVGTDVGGTMKLGNSYGVSVMGHTVRSFIGDSRSREYRNLISGNLIAGVTVDCGDGHVYVAGNLIGTDATGKVALGNTQVGIAYLSGSMLYMGGWTNEGANVIAGSGNDGVNGQPVIRGAGIFIAEGAQNAVSAGNLIGLNAAGDAALDNYMDGILARSPCSVIPDSGSLPNVISGNAFSGVRIEGADYDDSTYSVMQGVRIGTDISGETPLGNQVGVMIREGGRAEIGPSNIIAHNRGDGIALYDSGSARITRNDIFGNGGLGINLVGGAEDARGCTANDSLDRDSGPNGLQNHPVVRSAAGGERLSVSFSLESEPDEDYQIELFLSPPGGSPASGEGRELVGTARGVRGAGGITTLVLDRPTPVGWVVTATASREHGFPVTSEFSEPVTVTVATDAAATLALPQATELMQNYPNPFNPTTKLRYSVGGVDAPSGSEGPDASHVRLVVYDVLGREVSVLFDDFKAPGRYVLEFNANNLASGVYYYRLTAGEFSETRKMMVVR